MKRRYHKPVPRVVRGHNVSSRARTPGWVIRPVYAGRTPSPQADPAQPLRSTVRPLNLDHLFKKTEPIVVRLPVTPAVSHLRLLD